MLLVELMFIQSYADMLICAMACLKDSSRVQPFVEL